MSGTLPIRYCPLIDGQETSSLFHHRCPPLKSSSSSQRNPAYSIKVCSRQICSYESEHQATMLLSLLLPGCVLALALATPDIKDSGMEASRKAKLFYISTTSSTTTIPTFSICFVTSDAVATACPARKRRFLRPESLEAHSLISSSPTIDGSLPVSYMHAFCKE